MAEEQTKIKLSILIPSTFDREKMLKELTTELNRQRLGLPVQLLVLKDNYEATIGEKRNRLVESSIGEYIAFIDSDDFISPDYIQTLLTGIETNPDCISLRGEITIDGGKPEIFEHSITHDKWETTTGAIKYLRNPNHLNCIKRSIAIQVKFPEISHGEDSAWSKELHEKGLLKSEYYTDKILYYYRYKTNK